MAEEEVEENADGEASEGASDGSAKKKKLILFGGIGGVIVAGAMAAMMAVPSKATKPRLAGPFPMPLFEEQFSCNITANGTRFLQMTPDVTFYAYDPTYLPARILDPLYRPALTTAVFLISSRKSYEEVHDGNTVGRSTFMEELRDALDPILFPIHIGDTKLPWDTHEGSGLRPGVSSDDATFRGRFEDHLLHVDAPAKTLQLDDGPVSEFVESDLDVCVVSPNGEVLYVDVSGLDPDLVDDVKIGVKGMIIQILPTGLIVQ